MLDVKKSTRFIAKTGVSVLILCCISLLGIAKSSDDFMRDKISNISEIEKQGRVYLYGSVTESPCRLSMTSAYQSVNLGNIQTAKLQLVGDRANKVPVHIQLLDCINSSSMLRNNNSGTFTWSSTQPAVKLRFLSPTIENNIHLARVEGISGIGLEVSDHQGKAIPFGVDADPILLTPSQDTLTYYITAVRTTEALQSGAYHAVIIFELDYE